MPIFVDASDLTRLDAKLADAIDRSKEIRREMLTDVGEQLLAQVRQKIGGTGKVQRWQHTHLAPAAAMWPSIRWRRRRTSTAGLWGP